MTSKTTAINSQINIVILDQESVTPRRKKAFEIDALISQGFNIQFWDLSEYCFGDVTLARELNENYVCKIDTLKRFKEIVKNINLKNTIFVFEGYLAAICPNLNNYLIRKGACTVRYELNTTAALARPASRIKQIANLTRKQQILLPITVAQVIVKQLKNRLNKPYTHIVSTGDIFPCDININHSDYILYLESLKNTPLLDYKYILFLDQFYPFHPDLQSHGLNIEKNADAFFADVNRFFQNLEQKYKIPVVIAAHPKATYDNTTFYNRQILYGKSNDLVKDAQAVITIDSASISFVISHNKPLLLITTNDRQNTSQLQENNKYQKRLAQTIGTNVLNISTAKYQEMEIPIFSPQQRNNYIYKYLTSKGIENTPNIDLLPTIYKQIASKI